MKFSPKVTIIIIYLIDALFAFTSIFLTLGDNRIASIFYIIITLILLFLVIKTDILFEHKKKGKKNE